MKMKKFINSPETVTDELIAGLGLAFGDILDVDGHMVISKDLEKADRVTVVTYGGSGHEPAQAGYVGKGMLDIQVVGDIFKDTVEYLKAQGVEVVGNMVGEILTVQEAGGFQMNLAKWDDEIEALWNTPAHTPVFFKE